MTDPQPKSLAEDHAEGADLVRLRERYGLVLVFILAAYVIGGLETNVWVEIVTAMLWTALLLTTLWAPGVPRRVRAIGIIAVILILVSSVARLATLAGRMAALRPRLTAALPVLSVQVLIEMAKAYVELADIAGARRVMREAGDIIALRPRLGSINHQYEAMRDRLSALPAGEVGPSSLTTAELRLLPLLVIPLTYPEIGERLFISRHTVKTQAMSIHRKLGVSSRSAAVDRARSVGLLSL